MKLDRVIRIGIAAVIALLFVIAIAALLFVTESALNVWDRLLEGPRVLLYGYVAIMVALVLAAAWLIWRLVVRRKIPDARRSDAQPLSAADIRERLADAEKAGVDVAAAPPHAVQSEGGTARQSPRRQPGSTRPPPNPPPSAG